MWILSLNLIGALIGSITQQQTITWYRTLHVAPLTPPGFIFGLVWPILYTLLGVVGWLLCHKPALANQKFLRLLFFIQLILNWCWPLIFFSWHNLRLACICIIAMITATTALTVGAWHQSKTIALLLTPYLLWLCFAAYLNVFVWLHN